MRLTAAVVIACCTYSTRAMGQSYFPPESAPPLPARQVFLNPKDGPQVRGRMFEVPTPGTETPRRDPDAASAPVSPDGGSPEQQVALDRMLATVRPGNLVRVRLANGSVLEGIFLSSEDEVLRFDGADTTAAKFAQIDSLWEQKISKRKGQVTGAVTTAAIMAAGGALLFLAAAASVPCGGVEGDCLQGADWVLVGLAGFGVGGIVGGGLGTLLGTVFSHGDPVWVRRYPEAHPKRSAWALPPPISQ